MSVTKRWHRPSAPALLLAVAGIAAFLALGFWQLARGREKDALLNAFRTAVDAPLEEAVFGAGDTDPSRYPHLRVRGSYDAQHVYLLDNQPRAGQFGIEVFVAFQPLGSAADLLVNCGWIAWPQERREVPPLPALPVGETELTGIYAPISGGGIHLGGDALAQQTRWPKLTIFMDAVAIARDLGRPLLPRQLLLDPAPDSGFAREWVPTFMAPERHRAYAFQWFTFALVALVIFLARLRR